jgi:hypothetical protein
MGILLLPGIEGGFTHPELSAEVADGGTRFRLAEGETTCSSENFDGFISPLLLCATAEAGRDSGSDLPSFSVETSSTSPSTEPRILSK